MFISIIITARYWRARGSCVVAVMRRATSLKNTRASESKAQRYNYYVRVHERLRLTDKKDGAVPALVTVQCLLINIQKENISYFFFAQVQAK